MPMCSDNFPSETNLLTGAVAISLWQFGHAVPVSPVLKGAETLVLPGLVLIRCLLPATLAPANRGSNFGRFYTG